MLKKILYLAIAVCAVACSADGSKNEQKAVDSTKLTSTVTTVSKPFGVSFQVDDVELASTAMQEYPARQVFETALGKKSLFIPEEHLATSLVYCTNNAFVETLQECYNHHRPLVLTPDVIWLTICQGVSNHVNLHFSTLKNHLFLPDKPNVLTVRNDSLEMGAKHWQKFINDLSNETKQYTKQDFYQFFVGDYSTTTPAIQTAYQVTLLHTYKKGFEYVAETGCGIPSILVAGTKEDWQKIIKRLEMLPNLGLSSWKNELIPLMKEFAEAADGKPNQVFWQQIFKTASEYNAVYLSGWMIKLFPYIQEVEKSVYDEKRRKLSML